MSVLKGFNKKKKCNDCSGIMEENRYFFFENVCESCEIIRRNTNRCWICGENLTNYNHDKEDDICRDCKRKYKMTTDIKIQCPICFSNLEQDPENLFELWCPKCLDKKMKLKQIK